MLLKLACLDFLNRTGSLSTNCSVYIEFIFKDIQVFKQAKVYFSNEEDKFGDDRFVDFKYMPDLAIENARNVSINLKKEHGQYVMLQLFFNAKWILISEVTFFSERKINKPFEIPKINEDLYQGTSKILIFTLNFLNGDFFSLS